MKIKIATANAATNEEVIGANPENADMGNPDGNYYGLVTRVNAVTERGRRFIHFKSFKTEEEAEKFAQKVEAAGVIDLEFWVEGYEVYGSPAWEEEDYLREVAWQSNPATAGTTRDY